MLNFFDRQPEIQAEIISILEKYKKSSATFVLDELQFDHLIQVSTKGKQFRGCLLVAVYESLGGKDLKTAISLAAIVELYGTGLLIHDDIMDRADTRRGFPSTYKYFESQASGLQLSDSSHFGLSVGICLGDVLYFLAQSAIYSLNLPADKIVQLSRLCSQELLLLGLAQVEDIRVSFTSEPVTKETILKMYAGKTGRYTGRWPIQLASILLETNEETTERLGEIGEKIGVLFQLKDDELGIFGDEQVMGKSASSDITEGKKTLYYLLLEAQLHGEDTQRCAEIMGNISATEEEIAWIKQFIIDSGVKKQVDQIISNQKKYISEMIAHTNLSSLSKQLLEQVLIIVSERTK